MPFTMRCPACNVKLRVPNKVAERSARFFCPKCQAPIEKRRPSVPPPVPGTGPIPMGIFEPDKKPERRPPPPIPAGIPLGILDDTIIVPLSRAERVQAADIVRVEPHLACRQVVVIERRLGDLNKLQPRIPQLHVRRIRASLCLLTSPVSFAEPRQLLRAAYHVSTRHFI